MTPILVNGPFVALGVTVRFPPWEWFFDFLFRSYSCYRKKIRLTSQKVFPLPTVGVPSASKSPSALSAQALRAGWTIGSILNAELTTLILPHLTRYPLWKYLSIPSTTNKGVRWSSLFLWHDSANGCNMKENQAWGQLNVLCKHFQFLFSKNVLNMSTLEDDIHLIPFQGTDAKEWYDK